jgi:hypothetical protein
MYNDAGIAADISVVVVLRMSLMDYGISAQII